MRSAFGATRISSSIGQPVKDGVTLTLRIKKVVDTDGDGPDPAVTTGFVYEGGHVVFQFDDTGMTNRYLYGPAVDQVLADERSSGVLWALADNQGSVRDLVDSSGTPVNHVKYSAFGEKISETAPTTNFLFGYTGAVFDVVTNLGYHRARYLDHATGRWINQDPIQFDAGDANLYRYVGNSPANATDPSGLIVWEPPGGPRQKPPWMPDWLWDLLSEPDASDFVTVIPVGKCFSWGAKAAARAVEIIPRRVMKVGTKLHFDEAVAAVRAGGDVIAKDQSTARRIAEAAGDGPPIWDRRHGPRQRSHYHPTIGGERAGGHVIY